MKPVAKRRTPDIGNVCPDDGVCHHDCYSEGYCWRTRHCGPLSGVFPDNKWPEDVYQ